MIRCWIAYILSSFTKYSPGQWHWWSIALNISNLTVKNIFVTKCIILPQKNIGNDNPNLNLSCFGSDCGSSNIFIPPWFILMTNLMECELWKWESRSIYCSGDSTRVALYWSQIWRKYLSYNCFYTFQGYRTQWPNKF